MHTYGLYSNRKRKAEINLNKTADAVAPELFRRNNTLNIERFNLFPRPRCFAQEF